MELPEDFDVKTICLGIPEVSLVSIISALMKINYNNTLAAFSG